MLCYCMAYFRRNLFGWYFDDWFFGVITWNLNSTYYTGVVRYSVFDVICFELDFFSAKYSI